MPRTAIPGRPVAGAALVLLALLQAWTFRHTASPDGVAYLDLSDAILKGRPGDLVNGYWSPLYPTVIGLLRLLLSPTPFAAPYWEFAVLHLANVVGFILALLAFEWFMAAVRAVSAAWGQETFSSPFSLTVAYVVFGVAMLVMVSVSGTVPDLFLAASIFGACACLLLLQQNPFDRGKALLLGVILASGALTKSIMFPLGVVMLACLAAVTAQRTWVAVRRSAVVFVAAVLPWCVALSLSLGRPSTGETGALNFAWYVNHQQPPNTGITPRLAESRALPLEGVAILRDPRGTNPLWYDPTRWHADVRPRWDPGQVITRVGSNGAYFLAILSPLLLFGVAIAAAAPWGALKSTAARTFVVLAPGLAAVGAYSTTYATARYVAPFLVVSALALTAAFPRDVPVRRDRLILAASLMLLLVDALSPLRGRVLVAYAVAATAATYASWSRARDWRRWPLALLTAAVALSVIVQLPAWAVRLATLAIGVGGWIWYGRREPMLPGLAAGSPGRAFAVAAVGGQVVLSLLTGWHAVLRRDSDEHPEWEAAQRVARAGVPAGGQIAVLGNPVTSGWARLGRYQIVAVIPDAQVEAFTQLSFPERQRLMGAFASVGAAQLIRAAP